MPARSRLASRRSRRPSLALVLIALLPALPASAQQFLYALNEAGQVTVNATLLEKLPGQFVPDNTATFGQAWWDILVDGSDRWALRLDGRVQRNGELLHELDFVSTADVWVSLALLDGELWALRTDGTLARDGVTVQKFPVLPPDPEVNSDFFYLRLIAFDGHTFALRSDGSVFQDTQLTPVIRFDGGPGVVSGKDDGLDDDTIWRAMDGSPLDGQVYALRNDGKVLRATPDSGGTPPAGAQLASLPFDRNLDTNSAAAVWDALYTDILVRPDGTWAAINGGGQLFAESYSLVTPLIDFSGSPFVDLSQVMLDLMAVGDQLFALRFDGKLFQHTAATTLVSLSKGLYRKLGFSLTAPDLTHFKNAGPVTTKITVTAIGGAPVNLPVVANDSDKPEEELLFSADPKTLPEGATFDAPSRSFSWTSPAETGSFPLRASVSDGVAKPVASKNTVKLIAADIDPLKNKPVRVAKIKGARALVGLPFVLPIQAMDPDGDAFTLSVDVNKPPFTLGAVFDAKTGTFSWQPALGHIGTYKVVILADDGTKVSKRTIKLKVESSLLAF